MTTSRGNYGAAHMGQGASGVGGANNVPVGMGWLAIAGKTGDTFYGQLSSIVTGDINQGIFFQAPAGATVEFTLASVGMVFNSSAAELATVPWANALTVPVGGAIVNAPVLFTVFKLTFTGDGEVYVVTR